MKLKCAEKSNIYLILYCAIFSGFSKGKPGKGLANSQYGTGFLELKTFQLNTIRFSGGRACRTMIQTL